MSRILWGRIFPAITVVFAGIAVFSAFAQTAYAGTLSCSITTVAGCTGTVILRMSGATNDSNAHAELPSQANYANNAVCCSGVTGLGNSCSGTFATVVKLSGLNNAHVEDKSLSNYANSACISVSSGSVSTGTTTSTCTGAGYDTTIGSMSGTTNAHVGTSTAYSIKICGTAAGTPPPTLTSYTNDTETALNYAASCTGCGARIGGGAGFRQSVTITGTNFGADPGVGNYSTATNNVKVGAQQIATSNVTAWSATSITFLTDTNVAGDADSDWGADFGGATALTVTAGGATATGLNFYVFPQVTSITQPGGFPANSAREYNAADTDGVITLNGTRFGTALGTGYVRILGCSATTCTSPADSATTNSWSNTAIAVQVPAVIDNATYTGSVVMQQGTGSNTKTHTFTSTGFRILPRIASFNPTSGSPGDAVTVNGDHFCQAGVASCPGAFSAADKVTFTSAIDATVFTSWSSTAIATKVPTSSVTGNVVVTSNTTYTSNGKSFTVLSPTPGDPTSPNQFKDSGLTQSIAVGGTASSTNIYFTMTMPAGLSTGTLYPQIEYSATTTAFSCTGGGGAAGANGCSSAVEGAGKAAPGPWDCATPGNGCSISVAPSDGDYHWQARVCRNDAVGTHTATCGGTGDYASNWVPYGGNSDTLPAAIDVKKDTTAPVISGISSGTPGTNSATITWNTGEGATSQVQYNTTGIFGACSGDCTTIDGIYRTSHSVALSNLNSGTTYYYRIRARDIAGNEAVSTPNSTFVTQTITQPAKTVQTLIVSNIAAATTTYFTLVAPETSPAVKNAYVEVIGLVSGGTNPITVQFNGLTALDYAMNASAPTFVRMLYKVADQDTSMTESILNFNDITPCTNHAGGALCNKLIITPGSGMNVYIFSARFIMTYGYTP